MLGKRASGLRGPVSLGEAGTSVGCRFFPGTGVFSADGTGGRNLLSGEGVSRRSAAGGLEERLSEQCRRGDPDGFLGAVGREQGLEVPAGGWRFGGGLAPSSSTTPAGGKPEPVREAPGPTEARRAV